MHEHHGHLLQSRPLSWMRSVVLTGTRLAQADLLCPHSWHRFRGSTEQPLAHSAHLLVHVECPKVLSIPGNCQNERLGNSLGRFDASAMYLFVIEEVLVQVLAEVGLLELLVGALFPSCGLALQQCQKAVLSSLQTRKWKCLLPIKVSSAPFSDASRTLTPNSPKNLRREGAAVAAASVPLIGQV